MLSTSHSCFPMKKHSLKILLSNSGERQDQLLNKNIIIRTETAKYFENTGGPKVLLIQCVWINMQHKSSSSVADTGLPKCILGC